MVTLGLRGGFGWCLPHLMECHQGVPPTLVSPLSCCCCPQGWAPSWSLSSWGGFGEGAEGALATLGVRGGLWPVPPPTSGGAPKVSPPPQCHHYSAAVPRAMRPHGLCPFGEGVEEGGCRALVTLRMRAGLRPAPPHFGGLTPRCPPHLVTLCVCTLPLHPVPALWPGTTAAWGGGEETPRPPHPAPPSPPPSRSRPQRP